MNQSHNQTVKQKYKVLYDRVSKAIQTGKFGTYTSAKKQTLYDRLKRYENRLKHWGVAVASATALFLAPLAAAGQATPTGTEFLVNTTTTNGQVNSAIAMDSDGDFVVVWESPDADGTGIYAQRYDNTGATVGGEFLVNTTTTLGQWQAAVAMDSDGDFVITWSGRSGTSYNIYAQRYDNTGATVGNEFQINTHIGTNKYNPAIAASSDGSFVITWQSYNQDGSFNGIYARRYDNTGTAATVNEFQVNTHTSGEQTYPAVAMDSDGDFVITWQSRYQDGDAYGVYARRYDNTGAALNANEFRVNTHTSGNQENPAIAIDSDGDFVITWQSLNGGSLYNIYARRYDNTGAALNANEFQVNTNVLNQKRFSSVAMDDYGNFVVAWSSRSQDGDGYGIYARQYDNMGTTVGGEIQVNTYDASDQNHSSVAMDNDGDFVISWTDGGGYDFNCSCYSGQDGSSYGIYAQRYTGAVVPVELINFTGEANESGNLLTWATASEENNAGFDVQKSTDGRTFEKIGFVKGNGTTYEEETYELLDKGASEGAAYYRLKQMDFDGKFEYSNIVSIMNGNATEKAVLLYPNPVQDMLIIENAEGFATVFNTLGQPLQQFNITDSKYLLNTNDLPKGIYTLQIRKADGTAVVKQFVK